MSLNYNISKIQTMQTSLFAQLYIDVSENTHNMHRCGMHNVSAAAVERCTFVRETEIIACIYTQNTFFCDKDEFHHSPCTKTKIKTFPVLLR